MTNIHFTERENKALNEVYRRLNYFHGGDVEERLLILAFPNEVESLKVKGIVAPSHSPEIKRALNWYCLTDKGKKLFIQFANDAKMSEELNYKIFNGHTPINFNEYTHLLK